MKKSDKPYVGTTHSFWRGQRAQGVLLFGDLGGPNAAMVRVLASQSDYILSLLAFQCEDSGTELCTALIIRIEARKEMLRLEQFYYSRSV